MRQNNWKTTCLTVCAIVLPSAIQSMSASNTTVSQVVQQAAKVTGSVTDGKDPIIGASVRVKGGSQGTITDMDGNFKLDVAIGTELVISYVGYREVTVKASHNMKIVMEEESTALNEVVVTALGIKRERKALGYGVSEVKGEELTKAKETNVINSLSGKVAGPFNTVMFSISSGLMAEMPSPRS